MLTSRGSKLPDVDVQYHLQHASKIFHMNRWLLQNKNVSIVKRLWYFKSVSHQLHVLLVGIALCTNDIWSVSTLISGSCAGQLSDLHLARTLEWHEILHQWHVAWSQLCCPIYWRLVQHIATLPQERWIPRILRCTIVGQKEWGRCRIGTRDRSFGQCQAIYLSDASGQNFVRDFANYLCTVPT